MKPLYRSNSGRRQVDSAARRYQHRTSKRFCPWRTSLAVHSIREALKWER